MHSRKRSLLKKLNYEFRNPELLEAALTHRSVGAGNNERLEFLGDSILNFVIAAQLYQRCESFTEGKLSRLRANLVRGETLAEIGHEIGIGNHLHLGIGERKSGGCARASILADAVEALIGAAYLDSGFARAEKLILHLYRDRLAGLSTTEPDKDPKTTLQEYCQGQGLSLPVYDLLTTTGQAHQPQFTVQCQLQQPAIQCKATGGSRRKAEQAAADKVLQALHQPAAS